MPQNYKVRKGRLGRYGPESVLPEYFVKAGNDPDELVRRGILEPTSLPVNVKLDTPQQKPKEDFLVQAVEQANQSREELESAQRENQMLREQIVTLEKAKADLVKEVGRYIEENGQLRRACEEHQDLIEQLEAKVGALTATGGSVSGGGVDEGEEGGAVTATAPPDAKTSAA